VAYLRRSLFSRSSRGTGEGISRFRSSGRANSPLLDDEDTFRVATHSVFSPVPKGRMGVISSPTARFIPLLLVCLAFPFTASAQDIPVVTEDRSSSEIQQGDTLVIPIKVQNLNEAAAINAVDLTINFDSAPVGFVEFNTESTLLEEWLTDQSGSGTQAGISGAATDPLGEGSDSGVLVEIVFEVTEQGRGAVTVPEVRFNDVNPPGADLSQADFLINTGEATTIDSARKQGPGTSATLSGTVTRAFGAYLRFQDESGPTGASGLVVRQTSGPASEDFQQDISGGTIRQGTELTVQGTLSRHNGLLLISDEDLVSYSITGQGPLPFSQPVSLFELEGPGGADYESELLRVEGLSFASPGATGGTFNANTTYEVTSESGTVFRYRVEGSQETEVIGASIPEGTFAYEGVLGRSTGGFALVPIRRSTNDPVDLARFEATLSDSKKTAALTWQTSSETENAGFYVQHQPPEKTIWTNLGFVESGAEDGTSDVPQSYRFSTEPLPPGTNRFRLQQVSLSGTTALIDTVRVEVRSGRMLSLERIGPHPVRTSARLRVTTGRAGATTITLYDPIGRQVRRIWASGVQAGSQRVVSVQTQDLSNGTYFIRLKGPEEVRSRKLVVVQ
jgi:hypothetical protein